MRLIAFGFILDDTLLAKLTQDVAHLCLLLDIIQLIGQHIP